MQNFIKKSLAVLTILAFGIVLSGCGAAPTPDSELKTYDGGAFTIGIDPNWRILNESDFYEEVPDETIVAFTTPEAYDGFFINVNIVEEDLPTAVSSTDYARANISLAEQNLTDYEKVQEAQVDLGGVPAMVHIFQARLNPTEKLIRFIQLYVASGTKGYIVTGGMLPSTPEDIRNVVGASVTSFRLR